MTVTVFMSPAIISLDSVNARSFYASVISLDRKMRFIALLVFALCVGTASHADDCRNFQTPGQILGGLSSDSQLSVMSAESCGIASSSPWLRAAVIQKILGGVSSMTFTLQAQPKDTIGAIVVHQMPVLASGLLAWNSDGKSFKGYLTAGHASFLTGQLLGEQLGVAFVGINLLPDKSGDQSVQTSCQARMSLQPGDQELTGVLSCTGITPSFIISLGIV